MVVEVAGLDRLFVLDVRSLRPCGVVSAPFFVELGSL